MKKNKINFLTNFFLITSLSNNLDKGVRNLLFLF